MRTSRYVSFASLLFFGCCIFLNCSQNKKEPNEFVEAMDHRTKIRFRQYMIQGKKLYQRHCANCHGQEGEGLALLHPPLSKSDYLIQDIERSVCQMRNGLAEEIVVNGKTYNQKMPPNKELRALEIAEIMTYITNSWGNEKGMTSSKEVEKILNKCPNI